MAEIELREIPKAVNEAYPDGLIQQYIDDPHRDHGDTLAQFIVLELQDNDGFIDIDEAVRCIENAHRELEMVLGALITIQNKKT